MRKKPKLTTSATKLPSYKKPPVNEVVCGFAFAPIAEFRIPYIGLLWERFRKEYPLIEHALPLTSERGLPFDSVTGLPLPRVWFIDNTETRLIQFQADRFYFNWRHRKEEDVYPRYENIISQFKGHLETFLDFLKDMNLGTMSPFECELTYTNHIPKGQGWETIDDLDKVLSDFCWRPMRGRFLPRPVNTAWQAAFALPEDQGRLHVKLSQATRKTDTIPLLVLELSARGSGKEKSIEKAWDWFSTAHEWIVKGFTDITTPDMQKRYWEREDVASS